MAFGLKTKIWQTGALDWWGWIEDDDVFLGRREFPQPPEEGDEWVVKSTGDRFRIIEGEIVRIARNEPTMEEW